MSAAILFPLGIGLTLGAWAMRVHPALFVLVLLASLGASLGTLFTLVVKNGRRRQ